MPSYNPSHEHFSSLLSGEVKAANGYRMEFMSNSREYSLNDGAMLYPPEQVGLSERDANGNQLKVVAEVAVPASETEFLRTVINIMDQKHVITDNILDFVELIQN